MIYINKLSQKAIIASFTIAQEILTETRNCKGITICIHSNGKTEQCFNCLPTATVKVPARTK